MGKGIWPTGIRPNGNGILIRLFRHGKEITRQIEGDPHKQSDLARAVKHREKLASRLRIGLPIDGDDDGAELVLFRDAAQDYMNDLEAAYSTHVNYDQAINVYWVPAFGKWPITDITTKAIKAELRKYSHQIATTRAILSPLRGILDHAEINPNPARFKIGRRKKADNQAIERYTPTERQKVLDKLTGQPRVFFSIMFGCGLRPGEALALQWPHYADKQLLIQQTISKRQLKTSTKTYHSRRVYVPAWVRPILEEHYTRPKGKWVFLTRFNKPYISPELLNDAWREAHRKARVPYRVPYLCRHTRASELLSQGIPAGEAAKQLGHSLQTFIGTYAEWIDEFSPKDDLSRFEGVQVDTKDWSLNYDRTKPETGKGKLLKFKGTGC